MSNEFYLNNPLIHRDRLPGRGQTEWERQFDCSSCRPLIICRGPIRKEAMDVFAEMGITHFGILLSEKDSIVYRNAIAPELRSLTDPDRIHRVPDYSGADKEEREAAILEEYLPPAVDEEELALAIRSFVESEGLSGPQGIGPTMKAMMARYNGRADGSTINRLARQTPVEQD